MATTCSICGNVSEKPTAKYCTFCGSSLTNRISQKPGGILPGPEKQSLQAELSRRHRNLTILEEQSAKFGIDIPLHIANQIIDEKNRVSEIETRLAGLTNEPSLAAQYFSMASRAQIVDDLWEAKRYYEMTLAEDPHYPRASEQLILVKRQIVQKEAPRPIMVAPSQMASAPSRRWSNHSVGCILGATVVIAILVIIYWFLTSGWLF